MSPSHWGPPTWILFHTLASKLKEDKFQEIGLQLFAHISQICHQLPCPECASHAKLFLSKVNVSDLKDKNSLINLLYVFHNAVNTRKSKTLHKYEDINNYASHNIIITFNNFSKNFTSNGNMRLLADNFHRKQFLGSFKKWLMQHISCFNI